MSCTRSIWLLACVLLAGCGAASEGGVTGTGISAISGNIAVVSDSSGANMLLGARPTMLSTAGAPATPSGAVRQSQNPGDLAVSHSRHHRRVPRRVGDDGRWRCVPARRRVLRRPHTGVHQRADRRRDRSARSGDSVRLADGAREHRDPHQCTGRGTSAARAVRQLDVFGRVDMVECAEDGSGTVLLTDNGRPARQFMVVLDEDGITIPADRR